MTELERLLTEHLNALAAAHEMQCRRLSDVQQQQAKLIEALSQRVEQLTKLLQS